MAQLLIRECFMVRYQHIVRVMDPLAAQNWASNMDPIARDEWAHTVTINPTTQYQRDQIHLPIKLGGFGIHSYRQTMAAAHITSWISFEQCRRKYDGQLTTTMPEEVKHAIERYERNAI